MASARGQAVNPRLQLGAARAHHASSGNDRPQAVGRFRILRTAVAVHLGYSPPLLRL